MYIGSRVLLQPSPAAVSAALNPRAAVTAALNPVTCVRNIGVVKVKPARVKRKDTKTLPTAPVSKSNVRKERSNFKNTLADFPHNVSPIVQSLQPELANKLYSKFCMNVLKTYGFSLQFSNSAKSHSNLSGQWNFPGHEFDVEVSCSLHSTNNIQQIRNNDSLLVKTSPEKTIGILINNVGFKASTIRKFAHSENPCILLSIFDKTTNWLSEPSQTHWRRQKIRKCLHNQLWDMQVGFSIHKFGVSEVEVPECNLTRGLSLVLFNKAFVSHAPQLSAGKLVYEWPEGSEEKRKLKTHYHSTILMNSEHGSKPGKLDLYDVLEEKRRTELELLKSRRVEREIESDDERVVSIGRYLEYDTFNWGASSSDVFDFRNIGHVPSECVLPSASVSQSLL